MIKREWFDVFGGEGGDGVRLFDIALQMRTMMMQV